MRCHFGVARLVTINGAGRATAVDVISGVYESWVVKAWSEVEEVMQVDATSKGLKGSEESQFKDRPLRELLTTKQNKSPAPRLAARWGGTQSL